MTEKLPQAFLACFAHPDDEAFTVGGTMTRFAATGAMVALVCATRGEVGEISDPNLATPETLPRVREEELRCACAYLGVNDLTFLNYRDSGMAGSQENEDPRAFTNISADEVVPRLVEIIRQLRPQTVVTFDPKGGYGHPDHIAIHKHTVAAFHAAADPAQYPDLGQSWQADKLLYAVLPRSLFFDMRARMVELGLDIEEFDRFLETGVGWPDDKVDFTVDVSNAVEAKWAALSCHRTQFGPDSRFRQVFENSSKERLGREYFVLAWPETKGDENFDDIFVRV